MMFMLLPSVTWGATIVDSGTCGDNITWMVDSEGTLTISGTGEMWNYNGYEVVSDAPWRFCTYTKVIIKDGVTSIGDCAFYLGVEDDHGLSSIEIPDSVERIGKYAFFHCRELKSINLPYGIKKIDDYAFYCSGLAGIDIPASVEDIGIGVFAGSCSYSIIENIGNINVDAENQKYCSINGSLFNKEQTELIAYGEDRLSYTIPNSVNTIGACAFAGCQSITNIAIPNSVNIIEDCAFAHCRSITNITIPNSVNIIEDCAFADCSSITNITIPNSINSIGEDLFLYCDNLRDIYYMGSEIEWNNIEGINRTDFTEFTIHYNSMPQVEDTAPFTVTYSGNTATVTNISDTAQTADIIIGSYTSRGALNEITSYSRLELYGGISEKYTLPANGKIFVWNSLGGMKPMNK